MQHQLVLCTNNFNIKDPFVTAEDQINVFRRTDCDNEPSLSIEDRRFLEVMESSAYKNEAGNWELPLPIKAKDVSLLNNREFVLNRFKSLMRLFQRKPQLEEDYFKFMANLFQRGHAQAVEALPPLKDANYISRQDNIWYLLHFGVYQPRKPNKIRVSFRFVSSIPRQIPES